MKLKQFIQEKVSLDSEHRQKISEEYKTFKEEFEGKLSNGASYGATVTRQGSVSTRTAIKPLKEEDKFDLDIAILAPTSSLAEEYQTAIDLKKFADSIYKGSIHKVAFQTERGILDIDLVPMFGEVGKSQRVYNTEKRVDQALIKSDNLNMRDDFNDAAMESAEINDNALRESVMLAKYVLREKEIKGIPSVVLNALAMSAVKSSNYKQAMVNYISAMIEEFNTNKGYIHNPSNGVHIVYENADKACEVLLELCDSIIEDNPRKLSKIIKVAGTFFAGAAAVISSVAASTAKVAGGSTSFADKENN